ncbi:MAG: hypothetical protein IPL52_02095 [Flavobacteriales bacterium]|nr:hypothetical protein [Flavobacteriales bacterium]
MRIGEPSLIAPIAHVQDGALIPAFKLGTGANNYIYRAVSLSDGRILVARAFTTMNRVVRNNIAPNDCVSTGLDPGLGANNDRDPILLNIGGSTPTAIRNAQLP